MPPVKQDQPQARWRLKAKAKRGAKRLMKVNQTAGACRLTKYRALANRVVTTRIDWWLAAHCQLAYMPAGARHETARDDITWVRDLYDEAEGLRKSREETAALLAKVEAEREAATADAFKHASDSLLPDWAERRLI